MSLPTPVISPVADIPAASLPTSVALDGSGSLPASGATSVVGWEWVLHSKPPGSAAFLNNPTTVNPTLENIDTVGSYLVSLKVTDDLGGVSFSGIEPVQSGSAPYGFTFPTAGSMISIRVLTPNADLVKVAYGERAWLGRGLWELVDAVDDLRGDLDGLLGSGFSGDVYTDNIYELTPANDIHVHHPVRVNTIKPRTGVDVTITGNVIAPSIKNPSLVVQATTTSLSLLAATQATILANTFVRVQAAGAGGFAELKSSQDSVYLDAPHGQQIIGQTTFLSYNRRTHYIEGATVDTTSGPGALLPLHDANAMKWEAGTFANYGTNGYFLEYDAFVQIDGTLGIGENLDLAPALTLDVGGTPEHLYAGPVRVSTGGVSFSGVWVRIQGLITISNGLLNRIHASNTVISVAGVAMGMGDSGLATGGRNFGDDDFQFRIWANCDNDTVSFKLGRAIARIV